MLADEVQRITGRSAHAHRAGVSLLANASDIMALNLYSRLAQRVLIRVAHQGYRSEDDIYAASHEVDWENWFTTREMFRIDITASNSPLKSLNFAALRVKDGLVDRFRERTGERPSVDTHRPHIRVYVHLSADEVSLFIDSSGDPLFKRGWRQDKGDAPLKETLAAALIVATGWDPMGEQSLYDPCCGSGTIAIEAAQMACGIAPGLQRRFAFERLRGFDRAAWNELLQTAQAKVHRGAIEVRVFGSDVSHRMVDFAQRNAERAGVSHALELRGGDALQRMPPTTTPGVMLLNPPYGERIDVAGVAGATGGGNRRFRASAEATSTRTPAGLQIDTTASAFYTALAAHWKTHFDDWTAWVLSPDMKLPGAMRLRESRRVPIYNGPIECRLFRFDLVARGKTAQVSEA
jgi:putative N6-adenine-specific DNA methylase